MPQAQSNEVKPTRRILGFSANVFWLGLVSFFNDASHELIKAVMPVFLTVTLGVSPAFVGFLDGFADAVASILRVFSGWWSDKVGKRKEITFIGYTLSSLTRWFLLAAGSFWQVFVIRVLDRVGKGIREAPRDALVTESVTESELGGSFGLQRALDAAGGVVGPLTAVLILPVLEGDFRTIFLVASIIGLLSLISFIFVRDVRSREEILSTNHNHTLTFSLSGFNKDFKLFLTSLFIFGLGFMPVALVVLKAQATGLSASVTVLLYLVYTVSFSLLAVPVGRLSDTVSKRRLIALGFFAAIISYVILAFTNEMSLLVVGFILLGLYSALTDGVERAFASTLLESHQMASGHGFVQGAVGMSSLIAGTLGGLMWSAFSPFVAFIIAVAFMTLGLFLFIFLKNGKTS